MGEKIARAIEQGYTAGSEYHGYYFKILKGQGLAAPLGQIDFVVKGVMIGGFALVAAPARHDVTGVRTFIVSHDGVVYEKDLGPNTRDQFRKMELFNPDKSWNQFKQVLCGLAYKLARRFVRRTKILLQLRAQRSRRDRMQDRFENFRWSFLLIIF